MTDKGDAGRALEIYRAHLARHGGGAKAVGWGSESSQRRRFEVLSEIGSLDGAAIVDFGCGLGHFYGWLSERGISARYIGVDFTADYVKQAGASYPAAEFVEGSYGELPSILAERRFGPDYVFASGVFYLDAAGGHAALMEHVRALFEPAGKGLAFNCLSSARPDKDDGEFYADPAHVVGECLKICRRVVLRHDYHPGDFTCYLLKDEP